MRLIDSRLRNLSTARNRARPALILALVFGCGFPLHAQSSGPKFTKGADGWWVINSGGGVNGIGGAVTRLNEKNVWPDPVRQTPGGFLTTDDGSPVRVLSAGYSTPLFEDADVRFPAGVADVMKPFRAYYVVSRLPATGTPQVVQVAEPPFAPQSPRYWARLSDCFLWTTGLAAEFRASTPVYASQENARSASQPLEPNAKHVDAGRHPGIAAAGAPQPLSRLPVLLRTSEVAKLVCPAYGGEPCWVNLSQSGANVVIAREQ